MSAPLPVLLAIAAGGALGSVLRYLMGAAVIGWMGPRFPWSTLAVNVLGSFLMGIAAVVFLRHLPDAPVARAFVMVGVLGGFTTFSTFSLDVVALMERGQGGPALAYVLGSVVLSVLALFAGLVLSRSL